MALVVPHRRMPHAQATGPTAQPPDPVYALMAATQMASEGRLSPPSEPSATNASGTNPTIPLPPRPNAN